MGGKISLPPHELLEASLEAPEQRSSSSRYLEASPPFWGKTRNERKLFISFSLTTSPSVLGTHGEGMDGLASVPSGTAAAELGTRLGAVAMA